jgi:hypothetical protein
MVDLMLQDARVPAACVTLEWLAETIERLHPNPSCTGHDCSIAIHAEAAFEVVGQLALVDDQGRVHQYLRLNWHPLLLAQKLLWHGCLQLGRILDDDHLQSDANLRCRESDTDAS